MQWVALSLHAPATRGENYETAFFNAGHIVNFTKHQEEKLLLKYVWAKFVPKIINLKTYKMKKSYFLFMSVIGTLAILVYSCDKERDPQPQPVLSEIIINPQTLSLIVGETGTLEISVLPENAEYGEIRWMSSDESVAIVDENGMVTALAKGTVTVTATEESRGVSAVCTVTVSGVAVESVILDKTELELMEGDVYILTATVDPVNADDSEVSWTSSDVSVATVTENGEVAAIAAGNAVIIAEAGGITAECRVMVTAPAKLWDYYYEDGTWSEDLDPSKAAVGIIYSVNEDRQSGKVVSLDEFYGQWGIEDYVTGATDDMDGMANMETIKSITGWEELFPLFKWCEAKSEGGLDWYIPAKKELRQLYAGMSGLIWVESGAIASQGEVNDWGDYAAGLSEYSSERESFNDKIEAASGTEFNLVEIYWASDEMDEALKYVIDFRTGGVSFNFIDARRLGRAIAQF